MSSRATASEAVWKYQALGNDFLLQEVAPGPRSPPETPLPDRVRRLCDRRLGVGADGLLLLDPREAQLWLFNADGSPAGFSGNGVRCAGLHMVLHGGRPPGPVTLGLGGRDHALEVAPLAGGESRISVAIPREHSHVAPLSPELVEALSRDLSPLPPGYRADVGNPHLVFLAEPGTPPPREVLDRFRRGIPGSPEGINVTWLQPRGDSEARATTFERGVGPTPSCASAALACALVLEFHDAVPDSLRLHVPGGELTLLPYPETVLLEGPVRPVLDARWFP